MNNVISIIENSKAVNMASVDGEAGSKYEHC